MGSSKPQQIQPYTPDRYEPLISQAHALINRFPTGINPAAHQLPGSAAFAPTPSAGYAPSPRGAYAPSGPGAFAPTPGAGYAPTDPSAFRMTGPEQGAFDYASSVFGPGGLVPRSTGYASDVLGGRYLSPGSNPFLQGQLDASQAEFKKSVNTGFDALDSRFIGSGAAPGSGTRSAAGSNFLTRATQDQGYTVADILGRNYQNERGIQNQVFGGIRGPLDLAAGAGGIGALPRNLTQAQSQESRGLIRSQAEESRTLELQRASESRALTQAEAQELRGLTQAQAQESRGLSLGQTTTVNQILQEAQKAGIDLLQLPFQDLLQLMQAIPMVYPQFGPQGRSGFQDAAGILSGIGSVGKGLGSIIHPGVPALPKTT